MKDERRRDPERQRWRAVQAAEKRGNRIAPTLSSFAEAAHRGPEFVNEALYARHNRRFARVARVVPELESLLFPVIVPTYPIDAALTSLGATDNRPPPSYLGEWPDHVRWGLDSAFAVFRMVLAGSVLGAAAVTRTQLDRWTANRAATVGLSRKSDEATGDYYRRVWSANGENGEPMGSAWVDLSEALHGRGRLLDLVRWEAASVLDGAPDAIRELFVPVVVGTTASLIQVRGCVVSMMEGRGEAEPAQALRDTPLAGKGRLRLAEVASLVWPVDWDLVDGPTPATVRTEAEKYRRMRRGTAQTGRFPPYSAEVLASLAFVERRSRAFDLAQEAFRQEAQQLGNSFDPSQVHLRHQLSVLTAEMTTLVSRWLPAGSAADALMVAAGAVRPAFWLWLEDDERALVLVRTIIEQTARARAWRLKPIAAAKAEARPCLQQRWTQEAGWRRLSVVMRSLGEFAHTSPTSRWAGALNALAQLTELPDDSPAQPSQVARGTALLYSTVLLALETVACLDVLDAGVAAAFRQSLRIDDLDVGADVEAWLNRAWNHRSIDLGEPVFRPPTAEEFEAAMGAPPGLPTAQG